jgi:tetratricopeptide (TPR) repeat protein
VTAPKFSILNSAKAEGVRPMASKYFSLYADFFVHVLEKYIPSDVYKVGGIDSEIMEQMSLMSSRDFEKWSHLPITYLSNIESLALGIYTYYSNSQKKADISYKYFEEILDNHFINKEEVAYLASLGLGIIYFEKIKKEKMLAMQKKHLDTAKFYFLKAYQINHQEELALFYLALVEVANNELPKAINYLRKVAKISRRADKIYHILSCIYLNMNLDRVAEFYRLKSVNWKKKGQHIQLAL